MGNWLFEDGNRYDVNNEYGKYYDENNSGWIDVGEDPAGNPVWWGCDDYSKGKRIRERQESRKKFAEEKKSRQDRIAVLNTRIAKDKSWVGAGNQGLRTAILLGGVFFLAGSPLLSEGVDASCNM
jgi:hypothetical protein